MRGETFTKIPWKPERVPESKIIENFDERYDVFLHHVRNLNPRTIEDRRDTIDQLDIILDTLDTAGKLSSGNGPEMRRALQAALDRATSPDAELIQTYLTEFDATMRMRASIATRLQRFKFLKEDLDLLGISSTAEGKKLVDRIDELSAELKRTTNDEWDDSGDTSPGK